MKLHEDKFLFADIIRRAAEHPTQGGIGVRPHFIEKDYWIINSLRNLSKSQIQDIAVFKGGTSISKAYNIGTRFSEDIDIAIIRKPGISDAKLKEMIRSIEKIMAKGLTEIKHTQTSKGSRYRKTYYEYPLIMSQRFISGIIPGQLLFEINSFANPIPFQKLEIHSFIYTYLTMIMRRDLIEEFELEPFYVNVLDKRTTLTEKIVSIIRFSLSNNPVVELGSKIRHFYDIYYLLQDQECREYIYSDEFLHNLIEFISHDRELFENPPGWRHRKISDSPLLKESDDIWEKLRILYETELPALSYSQAAPSWDKVKTELINLKKRILPYLS